ncbi:hypothetical protein FIU28_05155 [Tardiphaga sp. vice154]|jgi:hypothetical protein|uniref:hypothetical protein n=1 Tax=Tardiphaga sp. vice154 TaxID=2592814 RepID=UPI0011648AA0|nr:hypothetical protein [Tardiphaga sp. vice154]QDM20588.1 hypothetical protein FIU28_05155 [Tardiphaga sp. vice154]
MNRRLIRLTLAVFVIVGLTLAPLVTPAAANRVAAAEMTDMSAMSGDTPCCSVGHPTDDCKDCPLMARCMLTVAQAEPASDAAVQTSFQARRLSFALYDVAADGLVGVPPDHPPRISI